MRTNYGNIWLTSVIPRIQHSSESAGLVTSPGRMARMGVRDDERHQGQSERAHRAADCSSYLPVVLWPQGLDRPAALPAECPVALVWRESRLLRVPAVGYVRDRANASTECVRQTTPGRGFRDFAARNHLRRAFDLLREGPR